MKNNLKQHLLNEIPKLIIVSLEIRNIFIDRLNANSLLTKSEGAPDHFCAFFVPVHVQSKQIYIGHHIKADDWIPPGGHIEKNELPAQTVIREFKEELGLEIQKKQITLFDLSVAPVSNRPRNCIVHYDIWHYVIMDSRPDFPYDRGEFHDAAWHSIDEAKNKSVKSRIQIPLFHLHSIMDTL